MTISLRPITSENWRAVYRLTGTLTAQQQGYVMPNALSMLEAFYEPEVFSARAIYANVGNNAIGDDAETPVGLLMTGYDAENQRHWLVRFMIGGKYQHKGYGRAALQRLIDEYNALPTCEAVFVSVEQTNHVARAFYASLGFLDTGRIIEADCIYRLPVPQASMSQP